jgi:hypothetical protein
MKTMRSKFEETIYRSRSTIKSKANLPETETRADHREDTEYCYQGKGEEGRTATSLFIVLFLGNYLFVKFSFLSLIS